MKWLIKAEWIRIHNFRTFDDVEIRLDPYTMLVGANNSGKSNLIDAIRVFYEKDIKFEESRDFPKFDTSDQDSWIEIQYHPSKGELEALNEEYRRKDGTLRIRKYLKTEEQGSDGKPKLGLYAIGENGSYSRFYGEKSVQQGKLGDIIYIPAVSKLDEHTKLTGPSALRDLLNAILTKILGSSSAYKNLIKAFNEFSETLKCEKTDNGESLMKLEEAISEEIADWDASFKLSINPVSPEDIVKNLVSSCIVDKKLGATIDPKVCGQGFQRHLIYTLIRKNTMYKSATPVNGMGFSPALTWILFEEPEAFLHPNQIGALDADLRELSQEDGSQVLITSHCPHFVSRNIENLSSIVRLSRFGKQSVVAQISREDLQAILDANQKCLLEWKDAGVDIDDDDMQIDMETIKYVLWLNPLRCCAFFADKVFVSRGSYGGGVNRVFA